MSPATLALYGLATREDLMADSRPNALGQALRGFLADELPRVRGLSRHTVRSFRDALKLLLVFLERHLQRPAAQLDFPDLSREHLLACLQHLEHQRGNSTATRNVRLAALHSFARYAAPLFPVHCGVCQVILAIPCKRADQRTVEYLEHDEMQALLEAPDRSTEAGRRDHALLLAMYNTGARVQQILDLRPCDLQLDRPRQALLHGKGGKCRYCPLWQETAALLRELMRTRDVNPADRQPLFRNRSGQPSFVNQPLLVNIEKPWVRLRRCAGGASIELEVEFEHHADAARKGANSKASFFCRPVLDKMLRRVGGCVSICNVGFLPNL